MSPKLKMLIGFQPLLYVPNFAAIAEPAMKTRNIAIVEALQPNLKANWTDFARKEYELGLALGKAICESEGRKIKIEKYYFAGSDDPRLENAKLAIKNDPSEIVIAPGNSANMLAISDVLKTKSIISPFSHGPAVFDILPNLTTPVPSIRAMADFVVAKTLQTDVLIALYDPTVKSTFQNAVDVKKSAESQGRSVLLYPVADVERNQSTSLFQYLKNKKLAAEKSVTMVTTVDTRLVVPLLEALSKNSDLKAQRFKLYGLAAFPPQFRQQIEGINNIEVYDVKVVSDVNENGIWMTKKVHAAAVKAKASLQSELSAAVAETLALICAAEQAEIKDWARFKSKVEQYANSKNFQLQQFHSNLLQSSSEKIETK